MTEDLQSSQPVRDRGSVRQFVPGCFVVVIMAIGFGALLTRAFNRAREEARQGQCICHLAELRMALLNYHGEFGAFPPAYVPDAEGKPNHSWRVLLLPFLSEYDVYKQYDFNEPWSGPNNRRLAAKINAEIFQRPSRRRSKDTLTTDYAAVVGKDTMFSGPESRSIKDINDGLENTIALVEMNDSDIHWMEPRDLQFDEMSFVMDDPSFPSISSEHRAGPFVVFLGRKTMYMKRGAFRRQTVRALLTANGGEPTWSGWTLTTAGRGACLRGHAWTIEDLLFHACFSHSNAVRLAG